MSKARSHYHMRKSPNSEGSPGWHDWLSRFAGTAIAVIVYLIVHGS